MKKIIWLGTFLLVFFLTASTASARVFFGFGFAFPPVVIGPPVVSAPPPAYYPYPYGYYGYYPGPYSGRPCVWQQVWNGWAWVRACA